MDKFVDVRWQSQSPHLRAMAFPLPTTTPIIVDHGHGCQTLSQHRTTITPELNKNEDDPSPLQVSFRARHHDTVQAPIPYSSTGSLLRVKFSSLNTRSRGKKKLVISGVGAGDTQKFEGIKRWCEVYVFSSIFLKDF